MISGANISFISIWLLALPSCRSDLKVKCQCYTVGARCTVHCVRMVLLYNRSNVKMHWSPIMIKELNIRKLLAVRIYQNFCENDRLAFLNATILQEDKIMIKIDILFGCDLLRLFLFKYHSQVIFLICFFFLVGWGGGNINWLRPKIYPPECDGLTLLHQEWLPLSIPIANNNPLLFDDRLQCPSTRPSNSEVASGRFDLTRLSND